MPFTFSHPALVFPFSYFSKKWFSLTGLIIGSTTPDFEYFLRMKAYGDFSHSLLGIFLFNLPLSIILAFIFHNIIKYPLVNNLPKILKSRFNDLTQLNWNKYFKSNWYLVIISALVGTSTHFLWDSFTHKSGFFVQHIPILQNSFELFSKKIYIFNFLQHLSTVIGGIIILIYIYKLPKNKSVEGILNLKYWIFILLLMFFIVFIRFTLNIEILNVLNLITTLISSGLLSLIVISSLYKLNLLPKRNL